MEEKKSKTLYILIAVAIFSLIAYFALTFLNIFIVNNKGLTLYNAAIGTNELKGNTLLLVSVILTGVALLLLIMLLILLPFRKKRSTYILLDACALPLLAFTLVVSLFISPIFRIANKEINDSIKVVYYILIPQNIFLFISIILNISILFYLSIKGYKRYNYERRKGVR